MVKTVRVSFEDGHHGRLKAVKGSLSWRNVIELGILYVLEKKVDVGEVVSSE